MDATPASSSTASSARSRAVSSHIVLSVLVPDRPGVLGSVASRIGAVGANITDVNVCRPPDEAGRARDVFHVTLPVAEPGLDLVELLVGEVAEVDGVRVEMWWSPADACCSWSSAAGG